MLEPPRTTRERVTLKRAELGRQEGRLAVRKEGRSQEGRTAGRTAGHNKQAKGRREPLSSMSFILSSTGRYGLD